MNTLSIYNLESIPSRRYAYNPGMEKLPNKIRHFREIRGLSQERLGKSVGKKKDTISKWERGERKLKMEEAKKLASVLGISLGELAGYIEDGFYEADENLMQLCAEAIQLASQSQNKKLALPQAMALAVMLYNHVIEYKRQGNEVSPNEAMAALLLKSI